MEERHPGDRGGLVDGGIGVDAVEGTEEPVGVHQVGVDRSNAIGRQPLRPCGGTGQAEHVVARRLQLRGEFGADRAGGSREEDLHAAASSSALSSAVR
ncbi:hypothetical protein GCM10010403_25850 [Glycomyces rutgersensis]|uniref:Uncharacterized protein n=1 Tax=Glycomyces rutgersensis TaxID=58115 RepID=A0ABN3FL72_9ACTN